MLAVQPIIMAMAVAEFYSNNQGRIQDFYDGVFISKNLQEHIGLISFDQLQKI